ncbi:hypothetical protein H2509_16515 [Stappia sp. F7233]|uniref:Uncharacterized protein n=1 Tax=Stappia albiluteola TaxID=2758565 RepID=A0A839AJS2_9HYPH|nr:hypothetical protein [Stappia albiluteola]MBA5778729.1 hypothetical protein [Stappia albiluteola]
MNWLFLPAAAAIAVAVGLVIGYRYYPLRKAVMRAIDPTWRNRARVYSFSSEQEDAEERDMYVSSTVMRDGCDLIWDEFEEDPPAEFFRPIADGTVVFVNTMHMPRFIGEILERMEGRFVLVSARENNSTAGFDAEKIRNSGKVIHWFMENFELAPEWADTGFITLLPLGLNYHKLDPASPNQSRDMGLPSRSGNQQLTMKAIREEIPPFREKPLRVYCNFHLNMDTFLRHPHAMKRHLARQEARDALMTKGDIILWEPRQAPRNQVWLRHREVSFEASPRGNSIDCHRTWEALILRSVPIVKTTSLDPMYEGLPVAIVDDWSQVSPERLARWKEDFADWFDGPLPDKLYSNYWIRRFHAFKT